MERGLYGQAESNTNITNASAERINDLDGEGLKEYEGVKTEAAFRATIAIHRKEERNGAREEAKQEKKHASAAPIIRGIATRGARERQQEALRKQADTLDEMKAVGYSEARVEAAYGASQAISMDSGAVRAAEIVMGVKVRKGRTGGRMTKF